MADKKNLRAEVITLTVAMAKKFIEKNVNPRPVDKVWAKELSKEIKKGEWDLNGESLKFDPRGNMHDGQHRCWAVVMAKESIRTLVVYGSISALKLDMGKKRRFADILRGEGEKNIHEKSAALRIIHGYEKDMAIAKGFVSQTDMMKVYKRNSKLMKLIDEQQGQAKVIQGSIIYGYWAIFAGFNKVNADCYFQTMLVKGLYDLEPDDPFVWLRNRFIHERLKENQSGRKLQSLHKQAMIIKAWNHWENDTTIGSHGVAFVSSGPTREKFPIIRGGKWDKNR